MPTLSQAPGYLAVDGVAGFPFSVLLTFVLTDAAGNAVNWDVVSDPAVIVNDQYLNGLPDAIPTVTSPQSGQIEVVWSGEQSALVGLSAARWAFSISISGVPCDVLAGPLSFGDPTEGGRSFSSSTTVNVEVGTVAVTVTAALGASAVSGVASFNGRTGVVEPETGDYTAEMVGADPAGSAATALTAAETFATTAAASAQANAEAASDPAGSATAATASEAERAEAAEATLSTGISNERTRAQTAEGENAAAISAETTRAEAAESANAGAIAAEATRAEGVEAGLIPLTQKGVSNGVATLDSTGHVPTSQLPSLVTTDTYVVDSQAEMLALAANQGDVAIRTDLNPNASFILAAEPASTLANWKELGLVTNAVASVNGRTGAVTGLAEETDLLSEVARAEGAESTLSSAITAEATARAAAVTAAIATAEAASDAAGTASADVAAEATARSAGDAATLVTATGRAIAFALVFGG